MLPFAVRLFWRLTGFAAVLLALMGQLALGSIVVPPDPAADQLTALEAASVFCQGTAPADGHRPTHYDDKQYAVCPLSVSLSLPAALLSPEPVLPAPPGPLPRAHVAIARARAPPPILVAAAYPRGPPSLV